MYLFCVCMTVREQARGKEREGDGETFMQWHTHGVSENFQLVLDFHLTELWSFLFSVAILHILD